MRRHQLHLMNSTRAYFIERHEFYVAQVKSRVLSGFGDLEREAEEAAKAEWQRLMRLPARDDIDMGDLAEQATNEGHNHYSLLVDLKEQMILSALAGCFHQWDKELREFLHNELRHTVTAEDSFKFAWNPNWNIVFDVLEQFGWDVRASSLYPFLDAGRLIVNVYKHGNGRSLEELFAKYPRYIHAPIPEITFKRDYLDHDWVKLSVEELEEIADRGIRQFWVEFPELMYYP